MNGLTKAIYIFDTNIIIRHLNNGNNTLRAGNRFISVITEMELLAKPDISPEAKQKVYTFLKDITIIPLSDAIKSEAICIRREGSPRPKLPDAIVAATAVVLNAKLVTADDKLGRLVWPGFEAVPEFL
ncbi:MAG: type II toxin-antitoxin system VapC family toxin [Spirochaetaceae bacterium]|jgi:predicted nucleic acid-binding protein|nr:type II toxin-antitoxin system VapC family toxin [Spirochaetaceae bacterium]